MLKPDDILTVDINFDETSEILPENIPLDIIFEDDYLIIINKPANTVVHPTCLHREHTLANAVQFYLNQHNIHTKIRFVNRLDKDTTGLIIFAKSEYIQESFTQQMKQNTFEKEYIAVVKGDVRQKEGIITFPITRDENSIMLRKIAPDGENAVTHFEVLKKLKNGNTLMKFVLKTGRTHQIRVHSKAIGHPILGDGLYDTASSLIDRQALHAYKVSFVHPVAHEKMEFFADIPEDIKNIIL